MSPYSSVVEHPLSKRKVGSSILPGGTTHTCLHVLQRQAIMLEVKNKPTVIIIAHLHFYYDASVRYV